MMGKEKKDKLTMGDIGTQSNSVVIFFFMAYKFAMILLCPGREV
jgi:hypothetical protein